MPDSLQSHALQPTRLLCPWDFPGKDTAVGCHVLLSGIFPTQGLNPGLLYCRQILYQLSYKVIIHKNNTYPSNYSYIYLEFPSHRKKKVTKVIKLKAYKMRLLLAGVDNSDKQDEFAATLWLQIRLWLLHFVYFVHTCQLCHCDHIVLVPIKHR